MCVFSFLCLSFPLSLIAVTGTDRDLPPDQRVGRRRKFSDQEVSVRELKEKNKTKKLDFLSLSLSLSLNDRIVF